MRISVVFLAATVVSTRAMAIDLPRYDIDRLCWVQANDAFEASIRNSQTEWKRAPSPEHRVNIETDIKNRCVDTNEFAYESALSVWDRLPEAVRVRCARAASLYENSPGTKSIPYVTLNNCIVMWTNDHPIPTERRFIR